MLLGEDPLAHGDWSCILPYFVVSQREVTMQGQPDEQLHHMASTIFYSGYIEGWPLHRGPDPVRIHEPEPYAAMAAELELAAARLTSQGGGGDSAYTHVNEQP